MIGIILDSRKAFLAVNGALSLLRELDVEFHVTLADPAEIEHLDEWLWQAESSGVGVLIICWGESSLLAQFVPFRTHLPVIALPAAPSGAADAALCPGSGIVMAHTSADAVLAALRVLRLGRPEFEQKLTQFQSKRRETRRREHSSILKNAGSAASEPSVFHGGVFGEALGGVGPPGSAKGQPESSGTSDSRSHPQERDESSGPVHRTAPKPNPPLDYSPLLRQVISTARDIAAAYGHETVHTEHFLAAMIDTGPSAANVALRQAGADFEALAGNLIACFPPASPAPGNYFVLDDRATAMIAGAKDTARSSGRAYLTTADFLRSIIGMADVLATDAIQKSGIPLNRLLSALASSDLPDEWSLEDAPPRSAAKPDPVIELDTRAVRDMQRRLFSVSVPTHPSAQAPLTEDEQSSVSHLDSAVATEGAAGAGKKGARRKPRSRKTATQSGEISSMETIQSEGRTESGTSAISSPARILVCDPVNPSVEVIENATEVLLEGGIVGFPTDTVYGLGVDATNSEAVERLYALKGRPANKAVALLIHSTTLLRHIVRRIPDGIEDLLDRFWPGPLTIVFERHPQRFGGISPYPTVGIRIPDHYLTLALLSMVARPVATSSANFSGQPESTTAHSVAQCFGRKVELIVDGGESPGKISSTVLSVAEQPFRILRHGAIPKSELEKILKREIEG